ncbi:MAG: cytochrome c-type biogenesis protein [Acidimicrobiales bacterium]
MTRRLSWLVMALVFAGAVAVGTVGDRGPDTLDGRVEAIASTVRCPTCRGQSAADSDATQARQVREEIRERLEEGETADEIRDYFASTFGDELLLTPPRSGVGALVWIIPVVAVVVAGAGLAVGFRRWRAWAT